MRRVITLVIAIIMGGKELIQRKLRAMTIQGAIVKYRSKSVPVKYISRPGGGRQGSWIEYTNIS